MVDPISLYLSNRKESHGPIAVMFHSIVPTGCALNWKWSISEYQFVAMLDLLQKQGWKTACVRDLLENTSNSKTVVLTFDDGYADNRLAFEALRERGMTATWFVVSKYVGREATWDDTVGVSSSLLCSSDLREMADVGMEIGSHSCTHPRLTDIELDKAYREVADSKSELEQMLGKEVVSFAYPYGAHNESVRDMVSRSGYQAACTARTGWALRDNDPLQLRRISIYADDTVSSFARKLAFAQNDVSWPQILHYAAKRVRARVRLLP